MRIFLFLAVLFILLSFIYKLVSFIVFKYKLSTREVLMFKQPGFKYFNKFHFGGGVAAAIAGYLFYKFYEFEYIILLWGLIAFIQLVNSFISPDGYLVVSAKGIRKHYNEKLLKWEIIRKLEVFGNQIVIHYGKKHYNVYLNELNFSSKVSNILKESRREVYERLFIKAQV
jgi:hypothetical protein